MAEIVNLRRARKAKTRQREESLAAENRARHGAPLKLRKKAAEEKARGNLVIDRHKLDNNSDE